MNVEFAEHLREHDHQGGQGAAPQQSRFHVEIVEILEAILLAIVALSTALSGFQAAKWDGVSARDYATSSRIRVQSEQASLTSNQMLIYNSGNLDSWLQAETSGNNKLAAVLARRFTPNYQVAFAAWLKTDPLNNLAAPPGPRFMSQYKDPLATEATQLGDQATEAYAKAVDARETGEKYVRLTVILAAVLFFIAVGQRFRLRGVRIAMTGVAGVFLVYCLILLTIYPRA
jgi:hypothetical protein